MGILFEQKNLTSNQWEEEAFLNCSNGPNEVSHTMCTPPGQNVIQWRIRLTWSIDKTRGQCFEGDFNSINERTGTIDMSDCCYCPTGITDWLTLEVEDDSPECPDGCKVTPHLNIPSDITCYKYYHVWIDDVEDAANTPISTPIENRYVCIDKGQTVNYKVFLYKSQYEYYEDYYDFEEQICYADVTSPECVEQPPEPCIPDCPETPFILRETIPLELTNCGPATDPCRVNVTYTWRKACNIWQDIQILAIDFLTPGCPGSCSIINIYKDVLGGLISLNQMNFEPVDPPDCSDTWRVANGGCWGREVLYYITDGVTVDSVLRWHPCEGADCCYQQMRVCRLENGVLVTPLEPIYGVDCPAGLVVVDDKGIEYPCVPSCNWSGEVNGEFGDPVIGRVSPEEEKKNPDNYDFAISASQSNEAFTIIIKSKEQGISEIGVYDLNGNLISKMENKLKAGRNEATINTSGMKNGIYVYSIIINGIKITSGKFVVAR